MKIKSFFVFNKKTIMLDIFVLIIGLLLSSLFMSRCVVSDDVTPCPQPAIFYIGCIFIYGSVIHFVIALLTSLIKRIKG